MNKLIPLLLMALVPVTPVFAKPGNRAAKKAAKAAKAAEAAQAQADAALDPARVQEIAASLHPRPTAAGAPISNRAFWQKLATDPAYAAVVADARRRLNDKLVETTPDQYLEFSRNGNRSNYEGIEFARRGRLSPLVLGECLENKGAFLPAINALINSLCAEPSWVLPAHDKDLTNFKNTLITIDLFSSNLAWQLAYTDFLLGEKLEPQTRQRLRDEVRRRVLTPIQDMIRGKRKADVWFTRTNNWNPVCFSGVTGAALILVEDATERAEFIAAAEHYVTYFFKGFTSDGYCSEGLGYWNYGFGMFAEMAENFRLNTGGKVNLFAMPGAAQLAAFGARITIINGAIPAFADCSLAATPSAPLMWLLNKTYGWKNPAYANLPVPETLRYPFEAMLYQAAKADATPPVAGADVSQAGGIRTVFSEAAVYIGRPENPASAGALGVALKGGNNEEQHNHNDIGSYVVVLGDTPVLLDPGPETYTARTFSSRRYESKLLNSYGHAVPVVAGQLQQSGAQARGPIIKQEFTPAADTITLDMTSAYKVPELKQLHRTFTYNRTGGTFTVRDDVEYSSPQQFETALISLGQFTPGRMAAPATRAQFNVQVGAKVLKVQARASAPFVTSTDTIKENGGAKPNRLAVHLSAPVTKASVEVVFSK